MQASRKVRDHLGNEFRSNREMAAAHGVPYARLKKRLQYGMGIEKALTQGRVPNAAAEPQTDHLGNEYPSVRAMCRAWGVGHQTYVHRLELGLSKQEALTHKGRIRDVRCTDPDGVEYQSFKAMCAAWGVTEDACNRRLSRGKTLREALDPECLRGVPATDMFGREFPSCARMCHAWHVKPQTYGHHARAGRPDALERAVMAAWPGTDAGPYRIRECLGFPWFLCEDTRDTSQLPHAGEVVLRADRLRDLMDASGGQEADA